MRPPSAVHAEGACLVIIAGARLGQCIEVHDVPVVIGRSSESDFQVEHVSVSRRHCTVWHDNGRYFVRDLDSKNGTWVNGFRVPHHELSNGDHIGIGEVVMRFVSLDNLEARYHEALYKLATMDSLTQLYNRREFRQSLDEALQKIQADEPLSLAMLDLDHFKQVNDHFGHAAGDEALGRVATVVRHKLRNGDVAGRLGGDEFAVLLRDTALPEAMQWCEELRAAIEALRFDFRRAAPRVTISVGLACWLPNMKSGTELMRAADRALLRTKAQGRNKVCVARSAIAGQLHGSSA
ncbi:MAG TPA: GGDEF domain-containing protein [Luteimonas sp.]|nr:GGDEF domain-containing protein [Luteimonas sp.]